MSKKNKKVDHPDQMTIDDYIAGLSVNTLPEKPGNESCNVALQLRGIINEIIRESNKSRDEIAKQIKQAVGGRSAISKSVLDSWTCHEKGRHIPLELMFAFEQVCGSKAITEYLCKLHGGKFIDKRSSDVMDLGQLQVLKTQLAAKERELKRGLS